MKEPKTVYEVLQELENYHVRRLATYRRHAKQAVDEMTRILLEHLSKLEDESLQVLRLEIKQLDPRHTTYLTSGPVLSREATHAPACHCADDSSFQDTLKCALTPDQLLEELLHRLEGCSAAASVLNLAKRLRELEQTKSRQIAKFTRMD